MAYTEDIARPLLDTLSRTAGLPTFQLSGHVPNLAFWMTEVRHALSVIDGYSDRHAAMVAAQAEYDQKYPDAAKAREHHDYNYQPPRVAVSPALAESLERALASAAERLIQRCLKEGLIEIVTADDLQAASGRGTPATR
jgi:hypothetical protein